MSSSQYDLRCKDCGCIHYAYNATPLQKFTAKAASMPGDDTTVDDVHLAEVAAEADPNGVDPHAPGAKLDAGKIMPWLCFSGFSRALTAVAHVTTAGATKYTPNGWVSVPNGEQRYMEGFARHMLAVGRGEKIDDGPGGTGCLHKAQMIWNLLASLELELRREAAWDGRKA